MQIFKFIKNEKALDKVSKALYCVFTTTRPLVSRYSLPYFCLQVLIDNLQHEIEVLHANQ